mgnify:CR=1 FL=1
MRKCYKCKEEKEFNDFHKDKTQVGGISYDCKQCKSETRKQKRKENPEKYREQNRKSLEKNYETIRASQKRHKEKNRDSILEKRRKSREERKFELNEKERIRRKNDPDFLVKNRVRYKEYYKRNREKMLPMHNAHKLVMYAIKLGVMKRPEECSMCESKVGKMEGHHENYDKPLDVIWVCKMCHKNLHKVKR